MFDALHKPYQPNYWWTTRDLVFGTRILQRSGRHLKLAIGDTMLPRGLSPDQRVKAISQSYFTSTWRRLKETKLIETIQRSVVFLMVFENMPLALAEELHSAIEGDEGYLGALAVEYGYGPHLANFRYSIPPHCRLKGTTCRLFFSMSSDDGKDESAAEAMRELGYSDVGWEDTGARRTIFDDFDTLPHFEQIARVRETLSVHLVGGEDQASELVMVVEDISPQLFNALGAAVDALNAAEHEEHLAQAALSGRRYLEKLADALFPARREPHHGRDVGADKYKNRLWAFLADNVGSDQKRLSELGTEIDRLVDELNGGLHGNQPKERILKALTDVTLLTVSLYALNPDPTQHAYRPFLPNLRRFLSRSDD